MLFKLFTPKELRDVLEEEIQKCDDPVQASYNAIARLNKEKSTLKKSVEDLKSAIDKV
jgi:hypothetical protein